jgi:hypothetical protein
VTRRCALVAPACAAVALAFASYAHGGPHAASGSTRPCVVRKLAPEVRRAGERSVVTYHRLRRREYESDLMGFRPGPRLGSPSRTERRHIRASLTFRHTFKLNPSRLLIRRLLRAHGRGVDPEGGGTGVPLAAPELRDLAFRSRVEAATVRLSRYGRRCAEGSFAGLYLVDRRSGVLAVTRFTTHLRRHRLEVRRRFRYGALLRVRAARFTMSRLLAVQRRIEDDDAYLRSRGIEVGATDVDVVRNRVEIELRRAPSGAGRYLSHRYRGAVRVYRT